MPPPVTNKLPAEGEILAGKYRVERVLGSGGMGVVVAATHVQLGERVALKFLRTAALDDPELVTRFLREARAVSRLKGEHIARVRDVGSLENGSPYIVMEYLEGKTFKALVADSGPLVVTEAVDYMMQACEALAEAHSQGIIHRDIKPANLFLARRPDGRPLVKVLDFGISKIEASSGASEEDLAAMTSTATMLGSPLYMSPEQMTSSRTVDARTDQWSVAVTLFVLLTGTTPFAAPTVPEICNKVLSLPPDRADRIRPAVPGPLADVLERCLQKKPADRFTDMSKLARALEPFGSEDTRGSSARIARVIRASDPPPRSVRPSSADIDATTIPDSTTTRGVATPTSVPMQVAPPPTQTQRSALVYGAAGSLVTLAIVGLVLGGLAMRASPRPASASPNVEAPSAIAPADTTIVLPAVTEPTSVPVLAAASASAPAPSSHATAAAAVSASKAKPARGATQRASDPGFNPGSYR